MFFFNEYLIIGLLTDSVDVIGDPIASINVLRFELTNVMESFQQIKRQNLREPFIRELLLNFKT